MATISFFRNVIVDDPQIGSRLMHEIESGEPARPDIKPFSNYKPLTAKERDKASREMKNKCFTSYKK
jgi:hypothetical protein